MSTTFAWSPDSSQIAFTSYRVGGNDIYVVAADGSNVPRLIHYGAHIKTIAWSPDGTQIAFIDGWGQDDIYVMAANGNNARRLTNDTGWKTFAWSPDSSQIAFQSGNNEQHWAVCRR
jgi:TolB protein